MCGICGTTAAADRELVSAMNDAMVHRGPDDEGVYVDERAGVALGARRLSIIDVAGGHQPLSNEGGTVWAVLNGEIYNHPSLRERLLAAGHTFASKTDTEVLVHLYEEYGPELVHALEGMYAFAVWDTERRVLLLARDRFGEKPLFYEEAGGAVTFASELNALRSGSPRGWDLDEHVVDRYFTLGYVPGAQSIVRGVRQLPPASLLVWDDRSRSATIRPYWSPPDGSASSAGPVDELVAETRHLLEESVRSRLLSDVPLGVFLSGGVDSTLVAALAARHVSGPLKTFAVGYAAGSVNELNEAARAAALVGSEHHELVLGDRDVAERIPSVFARLDQPIADQALVALQALAESARREVTVAVGGEGADELFGGYPRYRWLGRSEALQAVVPERIATAAAAIASRTGVSRAHRMLAPMSVQERLADWTTSGRDAVRDRLYGPRLIALAAADTSAAFDGLVPNGSVEGSLMRLDQHLWLPDDVLAKADRATMLSSLEFRTPYLARELAEFAASVPPQTHLRGGGKQLLRAVLRDLLPDADHARAKVAFRVPAAEWLRGPLVSAFQDQLAGGAAYGDGWFEARGVRTLFEEHRTGVDHSDLLWPVFTFSAWLDGRDG